MALLLLGDIQKKKARHSLAHACDKGGMTRSFLPVVLAELEQAERKARTREHHRKRSTQPVWEHVREHHSGMSRFEEACHRERTSPDAFSVVTEKERRYYRTLYRCAPGDRERARRLSGRMLSGETIADHPPDSNDTHFGNTGRTRDGMLKLRALQHGLRYLSANGWRRSQHQIQYHHVFTNSVLRKLFGSDFHHYAKELAHEFDIHDRRTMTLVLTPRRFGKTIGTAMFAAAYANAQDACEITICSTGRRASSRMLDNIYQMYMQICHQDKSRVIYKNQEQLRVVAPNGGYTTVYSYPDSVKIGHALARTLILLLLLLCRPAGRRGRPPRRRPPFCCVADRVSCIALRSR